MTSGMGFKPPGVGPQTTKNVKKSGGLDTSQTNLINNYYQSLQNKNSVIVTNKD